MVLTGLIGTARVGRQEGLTMLFLVVASIRSSWSAVSDIMSCDLNSFSTEPAVDYVWLSGSNFCAPLIVEGCKVNSTAMALVYDGGIVGGATSLGYSDAALADG